MLPVPISEGTVAKSLPPHVVEQIKSLRCFLVENAKTSRAFLKEIGHPEPIASLSILEIGHRPDPKEIGNYLQPLRDGQDVGILSEAGCPGIADPGAQLASQAQKEGIKVVPAVGPCSIILALMASGLDGQNFRFCGYLPIKDDERADAIRELEKLSSRGSGETQLFIETPYRNNGMLAALVKICRPDTRIVVATDITGEHESIRTKTAVEWKKSGVTLPKLPTVFGLLSVGKAPSHRKFSHPKG